MARLPRLDQAMAIVTERFTPTLVFHTWWQKVVETLDAAFPNLVTSQRLLGRTSANVGEVEEISLGDKLTFGDKTINVDESNIDHGSIDGLSDDDHPQYVYGAGRSGGQTIKGDTASGGGLNLTSTAHATKGKITFGTVSAYDESAEFWLIGHTTSLGSTSSANPGSLIGCRLQLNDTSAGRAGLVAVRWANTQNAGGHVTLGHSRSASIGSYSAVTNNDGLGYINATGDDGTDMGTQAAQIRFEVDGAVSTNRIPGRIMFRVAAGAADDDIATAMTLTSGGNLGIGATPTHKLDINSDSIRIRSTKTPASASATGTAGTICYDADYIYVCIATDTWKRAALATW